jgi:hypothetical protein
MKTTSIVCAAFMALIGTSLTGGESPAAEGDAPAPITATAPEDEAAVDGKNADKQRLEDFLKQLQAFGQTQDHEGALGLVAKTLKEGGLAKDETQQVMLIRAAILAEQKKFDEALKAADEAKAFNPEGKMVAIIDGFRQKVEAARNAPAEKPAEAGSREAK